jgi:hypothetical protein
MERSRILTLGLLTAGLLTAAAPTPGRAQVWNNTSRSRAAARGTGGYQPLSGSNTGPWAYRPLSSGWQPLTGANTGPWAYRPLSSGWQRQRSGYTPPSPAYRTTVPANPSPNFTRKKRGSGR